MTLAEAIDWISKQSNCSRRAATLRIRAALAQDAIGPLRWEDGLMDYPPVDSQFWLVEARIQRGRVFDPSVKRWRTLLIGKQSIFQIWPKPSSGKKRTRQQPVRPLLEAALQSLYGANVPSPEEVPDKKLRVAVANKIWTDTVQDLYPNGLPPNLTEREVDTAVMEKLKAQSVGWPITLDTVRRASGRRVDKPRQ
jgi:hypothetical protein